MLYQLKHLPGEIAHKEIMTCSFPSLVPQMVWFLGSKQFHHASFFVGDRSDYDFVHHPFSTSSEETTKAKHACEHDLKKHDK